MVTSPGPSASPADAPNRSSWRGTGFVLAVGSVTRTLPTPGLKHNGLGLKTLVEAEEANQCHGVAPSATLRT